MNLFLRAAEEESHAKAQRREEGEKNGVRPHFHFSFFSLCSFASSRLCVSFLILSLATVYVVQADEAAKTEPELNDVDREHWAYVPPQRPELPTVQDAAWCRTPVDRFILAKLEAAKLHPAAPADPATLLRRVTFDLTGLPPTAEQVKQFEADDYEATVDRLLNSRAYAERQAQHWLDLARYADTDGFEHDLVRSQAWRYRDWVIDAFARDLPLDEFLRLQIAGDELKPDDADAAIATGFLICGPDMPDLNRADERRSMVLNEITSTVGSTLLGLQIGCAQCHDHKFEPLSQADFYRLRSCFETAAFLSPGRSEVGGDKKTEKKDAPRVFRELPGPWEPSHLLVRGDFQRLGAAVDPGFPRVANPMQVRLTSASSSSSESASGSGRRSALASWLTRPDHPLTARVLVNRVWQQHFVHGLVRTPSDFGYLGDAPSHPELLDWLATELVRDGWSLKQLHRQIVLSAAYRQSGINQSVDVTADLQNRLISRFPRRRLDGEELRDGMLAASGRLSDRRGGPGVIPPLPQELFGSLRTKDQWTVSPDEEDHRRRSIYLFVRRNLRLPLLDAFDRPDTMASCPQRNRSTTAPQSLVLLNSEFAQTTAHDLAESLRRDQTDVARQIERAYCTCVGRTSTKDEAAAARELIESDPAGLVDFCLALFNLNEFAYVD